MRLGEHFDLWLSDVQGHGDSDHGGVFRGWNRTAALAVEALPPDEASMATCRGLPWGTASAVCSPA